MKLCQYLIYGLILMVGLSGYGLFAQTGTDNQWVAPGGAVGGGGTSSRGNTVCTGALQLSAAGVSSGRPYMVGGGTALAAFFGGDILSAVYSGTTEQAVPSTARVLKVGFRGGAGQATGSFYYRMGGQSGYSSAPMTAGAGDTLLASVTTGMLGVRGLEYYFEISRGNVTSQIGSALSPYAFATVLTELEGHRPDLTMPASSKYHIIGVPVNITGSKTVTDVFGDDFGAADNTKWRLGSFNSNLDSVIEYPNAAQVTPGRGYWLIMRNAGSYGAAGQSVRPGRAYNGAKYYEVALDTGWNMLANPFPFNIAWQDVLFEVNATVVTGHPDTVLDNAAYWYNGASYQNVTALPTWDGFFVHIKKSNVKALFCYREYPATVPSFASSKGDAVSAASAGDWAVQLQLRSGDLIDDGNIAGVMRDAEVGLDSHDFCEPPPAPGAPRLAFKIPGEARAYKRTDFRPPFDEGASWEIGLSPSLNRTLTVSGLNGIPAGMNAQLVLDNGQTVRLSEGASVTIRDEVRSARLAIGTQAYLQGKSPGSLPTEFALSQNYPNPFNPSTTINFAVPVKSAVRLDLFNILGQKVRTVYNQDMEAGNYTAVWYGDDDRGRQVASGVYFYRLSAGTFCESRKMLLLK